MVGSRVFWALPEPGIGPAVLMILALAAPVIAAGTTAGAADGWRDLVPAAAAGTVMAPNFGAARDGVLLTWLEKQPSGGHALRFARWRTGDERWTVPVTVAAGNDFFANWADFPAVAEAGDGSLIAHWLAKTGSDTYAYGIYLARSLDGGATWQPFGLLHDDGVPAEHGFVSFVSEGQGLRAFWLDGRGTANGGAMSLRTAAIADRVGMTELLDSRVCDCCQTGAAVSARGPIVVYRDRSDDEIRDMSIVRRLDMGWSAPAIVHGDLWKIPGCPVNGPSVAAAGLRVAVAWFTDSAPGARVQVVFSEDAGAHFGAPILIDGEQPLGRVGLQWAGDDVAVSWLAKSAESAQVRLRRVRADGQSSPPLVLASTTAARSSGVPRLMTSGDLLWAAWVEGEPAKLRVGNLPTAKLPR